MPISLKRPPLYDEPETICIASVVVFYLEDGP